MIKSAFLAEALADARNITRFFLSQLKGRDVYKRFTADGVELNNVIWLVAHLTWSEDAFVLKNLNSGIVVPDWVADFGMGSHCPAEGEGPAYEEVYKTFKTVHEQSVEVLKNATAAQLKEENSFGIGFGGDKTVDMLIRHCIRHESNHAGHLGWQCKLFNIATI